MKNREQLKQAFERFPKVDVLYTDGERIHANAVDGAKKVSRKEVFGGEVPKAKEPAEGKAATESKKTKTKTD